MSDGRGLSCAFAAFLRRYWKALGWKRGERTHGRSPGGSEPETTTPLTHSDASEWSKPDGKVRVAAGAERPGHNLHPPHPWRREEGKDRRGHSLSKRLLSLLHLYSRSGYSRKSIAKGGGREGGTDISRYAGGRCVTEVASPRRTRLLQPNPSKSPLPPPAFLPPTLEQGGPRRVRRGAAAAPLTAAE